MHGQLDSRNKGNIPRRAGASDENVHGWVSPDEKVGPGRVNPMGAVENMEVQDVTDYGKKVLDKITGGDGTVDGKKLNDNMKRESAADVPINTMVKKDLKRQGRTLPFSLHRIRVLLSS
ncbi:hypothetical protein KPG66_08920 [Mycetohabitans sp. B2]|uniref:hypothetical protein n=1 Tax=Mycetohabitans TaxID=2571159 RepID=UPI001F24A730|nr:hypothetical protein [Mycetohabitans sp. B2]MCF7696208.1 hypothetical protein [Mycetohabitans sp. B2]